MTLRECMALLLLYNSCPDADTRNRARKLVPQLDDAMGIIDEMVEELVSIERGETVVP